MEGLLQMYESERKKEENLRSEKLLGTRSAFPSPQPYECVCFSRETRVNTIQPQNVNIYQ